MVADVSSYPLKPELQFFGIKQNGHYYFKDANDEEYPFSTITVGHSNGRIEGESRFIKLTSNNVDIHGKEVILGISKNSDSTQGIYMEFYNLTDNSARIYLTTNSLGKIITDSFSIIKTPDESEDFYYYTLTYISLNNNKYYLL